MWSDSIYLIGESHEVCEDYAYSIDDCPHSQATISDGCSGSKNTDIGARILSHVVMKEATPVNVIFTAKVVAESMGVNPLCLDATLFSLYRERALEETVRVLATGDGFIAHRSNEDGTMEETITIYEIDAPNGYPKYLSYMLDEDRSRSYHESNGNPSVKITVMQYDEDNKTWRIASQTRQRSLSSEGIFIDSLQVYPGDTVAVFSDGVASFTDDKKEMVDPTRVITEFMSFKNYKGEFVKRRVKKAVKTYKNMGWEHHDDISMAAIHIGDL